MNDPRYLRRLVRELNTRRAGVYLCGQVAGTQDNPRLCGRARYSESGNVIQFPGFMGAGEKSIYEVTPQQAGEAFIEGGRGQTIYASRTER